MDEQQTKPNAIENLSIQVLDDTDPIWQKTLAHFEHNGTPQERSFTIKRVEGATQEYYINETKKELDKLYQPVTPPVTPITPSTNLPKENKPARKSLMTKHQKHIIIAACIGLVCGVGIGIGATYGVMKNNNEPVNPPAPPTETCTITLDAGIGQFPDGSRVKSLVVNKGTKLSEVAHPFAAFDYSGSGNIYTTKRWVTDSGIHIDEATYTMDFVVGESTWLFADFSSDLAAAKSIAIGEAANKATEAIARQPEARDKIESACLIALDWLNIADDGYEMIAIGQACGSGATAIARQPEAEDKIEKCLIHSYSQFHGMPNDGRNIGLGIMASDGVEAIARQPEAEGKINAMLDLGFMSARRAKIPGDGHAIGIAAGAAATAIARQPEAESVIQEAMLEAIEYINNSDDIYESIAIGRTATSVVDGIARQPEAEGKIRRSALTAYLTFHTQPNDGRVEGMGKMSGQVADSIARQPEAEGKINEAADLVYNALPHVDNPLKGQALSNAGAGAIESIARQPEAEGMIRMTLYMAVQEILKA